MTFDRSRSRALATACVVMLGAGLSAQEPTATPLSLSEAITRALTTSQRLAEALTRVDGARAAVRTRQLADAPSVAVSGGYTRTNHVDEFGVPQPGGALRVIYPDIPDNYFTRATLQWPIYTAGRVDALVRAASAEAEAVSADADTTRADLRLEVTRAYWALSTATETVRVMQQALARAEVLLGDVQARLASGLVPPNDVSAAETLRARQQVQLIEAANLQRSVRLDLARLTGVPNASPIDPLEAGNTSAPPSAAAGPSRPELLALGRRIAASEERAAAVLAGHKPTIVAHAAGDYANPNPRIFPRAGSWRTSWELGIVASWSLWDGGRIDAEHAEAQIATRALVNRRSELASIVDTEIEQRRLDLGSAQAALEAANVGVRSATENRRVVRERFTVGVAVNADVIDAEVVLLQAELDRTRALARIRLAEARLQRALGTP